VQRRRNRRIIDPAHRITTLKVRTTMLQLPGDWIDEMHEGAVFHVRLTLHVDRAVSDRTAVLVGAVARSRARVLGLTVRQAALQPLQRPRNHQWRPLPNNTSNPIAKVLHQAALPALRPLKDRPIWTDELHHVMQA
jgi:hypothetical protein